MDLDQEQLWFSLDKIHQCDYVPIQLYDKFRKHLQRWCRKSPPTNPSCSGDRRNAAFCQEYGILSKCTRSVFDRFIHFSKDVFLVV